MRRMRWNYHSLQVLKNASPKLRKTIISNCDGELLNALSEINFNILRGNVQLSTCSRRKLRQHKNALRTVADNGQNINKRRQFLIQRGGFILPLLTAVLPTLASLLFRPRGNRERLRHESSQNVSRLAQTFGPHRQASFSSGQKTSTQTRRY
jgi:hypothetical protein